MQSARVDGCCEYAGIEYEQAFVHFQYLLRSEEVRAAVCSWHSLFQLSCWYKITLASQFLGPGQKEIKLNSAHAWSLPRLFGLELSLRSLFTVPEEYPMKLACHNCVSCVQWTTFFLDSRKCFDSDLSPPIIQLRFPHFIVGHRAVNLEAQPELPPSRINSPWVSPSQLLVLVTTGGCENWLRVLVLFQVVFIFGQTFFESECWAAKWMGREGYKSYFFNSCTPKWKNPSGGEVFFKSVVSCGSLRSAPVEPYSQSRFPVCTVLSGNSIFSCDRTRKLTANVCSFVPLYLSSFVLHKWANISEF